MTTAVIAVDGVLRHPMSLMPISEGIHLWQALSSMYPIVLFVDSSTHQAAQWLSLNNINGWVTAIANNEDIEIGEKRLKQIKTLRADGITDKLLLIDSNPRAIEAVFPLGINGLLFVSPKYAEPNHRPDYDGAVKPWKSLVKQLEWQDEMYEKDSRLVTES